jgi:hypothetical protein
MFSARSGARVPCAAVRRSACGRALRPEARGRRLGTPPLALCSNARVRPVALALLIACAQCSAPPRSCTECGSVCADLRTDSQHCGACGNACAPGTRCEDNTCVVTCAGLQCGNTCVDPLNDPAHCGGCDNRCGATPHAAAPCIQGACTIGTCEAGWVDCDGDTTNGCERAGTYCGVELCSDLSCQLVGMSADGQRLLINRSVRDPQPDGGAVPAWGAFLELRDGGPSVRVNVDSDGNPLQGPLYGGLLSGDGHWAVFRTTTGLYLRDLDARASQQLPRRSNDGSDEFAFVAISHDGSRLVHGYQLEPLYLRELRDGGWFRLNATTAAHPTLSGDGQWLGVVLENARAHDLNSGVEDVVLPRVSDAGFNGTIEPPVFSFNGGRRAFGSSLPGFEPGQTTGNRIYVVDRSGPLMRPDGGLLVFEGSEPTLSADGRLLAYVRVRANLALECLVVEIASGRTLQSSTTVPALGQYCSKLLSADGRTLALYDGRKRTFLLEVPR